MIELLSPLSTHGNNKMQEASAKALFTRESRGSREKGLFPGAEYLGSRVSKILISRVWDLERDTGEERED